MIAAEGGWCYVQLGGAVLGAWCYRRRAEMVIVRPAEWTIDELLCPATYSLSD
jgi:hypothetical protein